MDPFKNDADYLTKKYKGLTWDELYKNFEHWDQKSHTVRYENKYYICSCDRYDVCEKFFHLMDGR